MKKNVVGQTEYKDVVFLASGGGSTMKVLHLFFSQFPQAGFRVVGVIADRECGALDYAKFAGLHAKRIRYARSHPQELREALEEVKATWIVTNIHKIIDADTLAQFNGKMVNLHYSLLPAFGGMIGEKPVQESVSRHCKFVGTTVHYVSEEVDAGEIISQSVVSVYPQEEFSHLMNRVFRSGCKNLINSILCLSGVDFELLDSVKNMSGLQGSVMHKLENHPKSSELFNPSLRYDSSMLEEIFEQLADIGRV